MSLVVLLLRALTNFLFMYGRIQAIVCGHAISENCFEIGYRVICLADRMSQGLQRVQTISAFLVGVIAMTIRYYILLL